MKRTERHLSDEPLSDEPLRNQMNRLELAAQTERLSREVRRHRRKIKALCNRDIFSAGQEHRNFRAEIKDWEKFERDEQRRRAKWDKKEREWQREEAEMRAEWAAEEAEREAEEEMRAKQATEETEWEVEEAEWQAEKRRVKELESRQYQLFMLSSELFRQIDELNKQIKLLISLGQEALYLGNKQKARAYQARADELFEERERLEERLQPLTDLINEINEELSY